MEIEFYSGIKGCCQPITFWLMKNFLRRFTDVEL